MRPPRRGLARPALAAVRALLALVALVALLATACGGDGEDEPARPVLAQIAPAVAAVEAELGGPQQYFEINATPQLVNVFVATDEATRVVPYVYVGGELAPAGDPAAAEGATFTAAALTFDPATILDDVTTELADSDILLFSISGGPDGAVQYAAGVRSHEGGPLDVVLGTDGFVQSVTPGG